MVRDAALREIIGANALGAVTGADQQLALCCLFRCLFGDLHVQQTCLQQGHRAGAVLVLGTLVLALDHDPRRQVCEADRRIGFVHVLAAGSRGAIGIDAKVGGRDVDRLDLVRFRQHGDGTG